jgi:hypothetical protein
VDQYGTGDVAQIGSCQLQHSPDTSAQHHFGGRKGEARDLRAADVRASLSPARMSLGCSIRISWMPAALAIAA